MEKKSEEFQNCIEDESWSDSELICLAQEMLENYEEELERLNEVEKKYLELIDKLETITHDYKPVIL